MLKIRTRVEEIKNSKYQTEKNDHANMLKSFKTGNEYYKKKYKSLNKKKVLSNITGNLVGSGSTKTSSLLSIFNPSAVIDISSSPALLTSVAILITNEYISKLKFRYNKLRDWIDVITKIVLKDVETIINT